MMSTQVTPATKSIFAKNDVIFNEVIGGLNIALMFLFRCLSKLKKKYVTAT